MSAAAPPSEFLQKLRSGAGTGDYTELISLLRGLSPVAVDQQLQAMKVSDATVISSKSSSLLSCLAYLSAKVSAAATQNLPFGSFHHVKPGFYSCRPEEV